MKKFIYLLFIACLTISFSGCGFMYIDTSKENKAYGDTLTDLFDALDNGDADAIFNLFSPAVREEDVDLEEQIAKLLSVYNGPTDAICWDGLLGGGGYRDSGKKSNYAIATFPVRSGDTYYWCYLDLMYENTFDEKQIGITQLDFYTADEFCIFRYSDLKTPDSVGLTVNAEQTLEEEVYCISGWPHKYSLETKPLDIEAVNDFLKKSQNFTEFRAKFGEPNAEYIYTYYELPKENGKPRYLEMGVDGENIHSAVIVDNLKYIKTIYDEYDK